MTATRLAAYVVSALVGVLGGGVGVLALDSMAGRRLPPPSPPAHTDAAHVDRDVGAATPEATVLLAWAPGGLPSRTERVLEGMRGVRAATTVRAGLDWIESSRAPTGAMVDAPAPPFAIPIEMAIVEPSEYASFVPPGERDAVLALRRGQVLLARTEADLRRGGQGLALELRSGRMRTAAVISDVATNGYEALRRGPVPSSWRRVDRYVLARVRGADLERVERRMKGLLAPGQVLRVRTQRGPAEGETPFLRYGDAVLPQMLLKRTFGEFAAVPQPDGSIEVDPAWRNKNIRSAVVPVLGRVTCHRALFPQLERALSDVVASGLAHTIDPAQFGGCYSPRFISSDPDGRLSHHSWGIAIDFNASDNAFGTKADLDRRLVDKMETWGFTWGGRWLIPDGMHFEWVSFP